jgi:hypothetical protein
MGSEEGHQLFLQVEGLDFSVGLKHRDKSIYHIFMEEETKRCRLCGVNKGSHIRAVSCVRSHINHRPFRCVGLKLGCRKCDDRINGYVNQLNRPEDTH